MAIAIFKSLLIPLIGWTLSIAASRVVHVPVDWLGVAACITGIFAAYRLDHLLDHRHELAPAELQRELASVGAAGAVLLLVAWSRPEFFVPLALLGALGVFYIPLKRVVPKNLLTASAWAICVVTLSLDLPLFSTAHTLASTMIFFLVLANASLCDLPDIESDRANQVRVVAPALGIRVSGRVSAGIAAIALGIAIALGSVAFAVPAAVYIAVGSFLADQVARRRDRRWLLDAVLLLPGPISFVFA